MFVVAGGRLAYILKFQNELGRPWIIFVVISQLNPSYLCVGLGILGRGLGAAACKPGLSLKQELTKIIVPTVDLIVSLSVKALNLSSDVLNIS